MFSPPHDLLDCRQLYIDVSHFFHAVGDLNIILMSKKETVYTL
jgi:hypothetical protein